MNNSGLMPLFRRLRIFLGVIAGILVICLDVHAQEKPPKPITVAVSTVQHLSFGTFIQSGLAGTVTVDHTGFRSATGDIILPNMSSIVTPALFEVTALRGTLITIVNGPDTALSGSHGGTIYLRIGDSNTGSPFVVTGPTTNVFIGGTLTVASLSANPEGVYNGTFTIIFIQN
ncbi:MAG: DUF4402 domain-containing protein [Mariniphaga sp.]